MNKEKLFLETAETLINSSELNQEHKILIVGLGNKNINSDSLGYNVVNKIKSNSNKYYLIYKNVEEITKINSFDFIKNLNNYLKPELIIIIDSLKAQNIERLNYTIQITSGGINPGSGNDIKTPEISENTLKTKTISIGVPLLIDTNSIINDTIDYLKINSDSLKKRILKNIKYSKYDILVSTSDIDNIVELVSYIISEAIVKYIR